MTAIPPRLLRRTSSLGTPFRPESAAEFPSPSLVTSWALLTTFCPLRSRQAPVRPSRRLPARTLGRFLELKTALRLPFPTLRRPPRPQALLHRRRDSCPGSWLHFPIESEK